LTYNAGVDTVGYDWFQTSEPSFTASGTLTRA
jgi:hypothetical protein